MNALIEKLKKIKASQAIYPAIVSLLVIVTTACFIFSVRFISSTINKTFVVDTSPENSAAMKLNLPAYYAAAKKIGIATDAAAAPPAVAPASTPPPQGTSSTPPAAPQDKKALKIEVLNSTPVRGVAANLASLLTAAGYSVAKTGNQQTQATTTLIMARTGAAQSFIQEIRGIVSQKYNVGDTQALPAGSEYDVVIVIGAK